MSNWCEWSVVVEGADNDLRSVSEFVETLFVDKGPSSHGSEIRLRVLECATHYPDVVSCAWFDCPHHGIEVSGGAIRVSGVSKWAPPGDLVMRISERFPKALFSLTGDTESEELYEHWHIQAGKALCKDMWWDLCPDEGVLVQVRNGEVFDPPVVWASPDDRSDVNATNAVQQSSSVSRVTAREQVGVK